MRIKLNLENLTPNRVPSVYWLHVDITDILLIKQLKNKVQKVLKEIRGIELYLDNIPFLDEDDIHVINENEEITVKIIETDNYIDLSKYKTEKKQFDVSIADSFNASNESINPINVDDSANSNILLKDSKKRVRKRTHKKKKPQIDETVEILNNNEDIEVEVPSITSTKSVKMHKRFKLDHEENYPENETSPSMSSVEEHLHVVREVFRCNSSSISSEKKNINKPVWKQDNISNKPFKANVNKVPVFVRGQTCTPVSSTLNGFNSENKNSEAHESSESEDYDFEVVDWKNKSVVKVTDISDLKILDLLQFKTLCMNEHCEPEISSIITARLENIIEDTLYIQVLSGIKEFITLNPKFKMDDEEEIETLREVKYNDLYELVKLV